MATVVKRIEPHRRLGLSSTPSMQIAQASGLAAVKGAPIYIDSSGNIASTLTSGGATGYAVTTVASGALIAGFLQEDTASDTTKPKISFTPSLPGMMFKGQLVESTTGSLHVLAQTDVGSSGGLIRFSGDTHFGVNTTPGSSQACVMITELLDDIGTTGGMVGFVVRASFRQLDLG